MDALEILFTASFWAAALRIASPLIFATMGELLCERAGVLNLGIEGIMTAGAFAGWLTVYLGGDLWAGRAGRRPGRRGLRPAARVPHRAARPVAARRRHRHHAARHQPHLLHLSRGPARSHVAAEDRAVRALPIPGLSDIPLLGEALFRQTPLTYLAFVLVAAGRLVPLPHAGSASRCAPSARTRPRPRRRASTSPRCASARSSRAAR